MFDTIQFLLISALGFGIFFGFRDHDRKEKQMLERIRDLEDEEEEEEFRGICPKCGGCGETASWDSEISFMCRECDGTGEVKETEGGQGDERRLREEGPAV